MRYRYIAATTALVIGIVTGVWLLNQPPTGGTQTPREGPATVPRTPWDTPDLSGIWNSNTLTPFERPAKFADREFLTDEEITAIEQRNARQRGRDVRAKTGTEADVEGAYNQIFTTALNAKYARNKRSSLIVDPPDGRMPALTPEGKRKMEEIRRGAARSPDAAEAVLAAFGEDVEQTPYAVEVICSPNNTLTEAKYCRPADNPEDFEEIERCLGLSSVPSVGGNCGIIRIVQGPDSVMIYYEQGHGGGDYRVIPLDGPPHPPSNIRAWLGHSTGRWEGDTLVVETANFTRGPVFRVRAKICR